MKKHEISHTRNEPFGCSLCDFECWTTGALNEEAWNTPHWEWTHRLVPIWLRVFNIKCFDWGSMKYPTLRINPSAAPNVTSSFQHQVLWLRKHKISHTRDKPFSCSLITSALVSSKSRKIVPLSNWKGHVYWFNIGRAMLAKLSDLG